MNSDNKKIEGLGDIIKRLTSAVGVKPCSKCEERRKKLNVLFPFGKRGQTPDEEPDPIETSYLGGTGQ